MHEEVALVKKLNAPSQMATRAAHAFGNCIEFAALEREEGEDAVGFAELPPAQDHASRLIGARLRQGPPIPVLC